jgi:hypothetical protein
MKFFVCPSATAHTPSISSVNDTCFFMTKSLLLE